MSQDDLVRETGLSRGTITAIEQGLTHSPHPHTLQRLAEVFGVSTTYLLTGYQQMDAETAAKLPLDTYLRCTYPGLLESDIEHIRRTVEALHEMQLRELAEEQKATAPRRERRPRVGLGSSGGRSPGAAILTVEPVADDPW